MSNGELIFVLNSAGMLTYYDAKNGGEQWDYDFDEPCNASPSIAGNRLMLITNKGTLIAVEAAREFKELARSPIGEKVFASPALAQGRMFVRGIRHLICIGAKSAAPTKP
ncbi:hypothetical protein LBMAG57_38580 [Verrucomicrobiota bacterium]|nr:hypothetical protein LBMAG57_38580 [Verrucomicrobiota bacterium]